VYTTAAARACGLCGSALPEASASNRRLCDDCRGISRALTFLRQASAALEPTGEQGVLGEIEVLIGRLELAR